MPCDQVSVFSLEFKPENYDLLGRAVRGMGGTIMRNAQTGEATLVVRGCTIRIAGGKATLESRTEAGAERIVNDVRLAYTQAAVAQATAMMKEKGWRLQKSGDNRMRLMKGK